MAKFFLLVSMAGAGVAGLLSAGNLAAVDVSQFLTEESRSYLNAGSPGGIASDGISFLMAAQSTTGGIMAIRLATNGTMPGPPLDLGRTGGPPRVAFDGGNYLLVWPDLGDLPSDIYGQFIRPDGTIVGSPFLIEADAAAEEIGGLAFDGTNYLVVWERNGNNSNLVSTVQGRFITPSGSLLGPRLQISDGPAAQKYPNVAWNGENYLVIWTGQTEGTNEWNVQGRRLNRGGVPLGGAVINENPAQQPWPPALASDGTNWLVAWSRESGPYLVLSSNVWLPMLYGRIVARDGTVFGQEVQIRRAGLGQFKPKATFNGENYLVGWMDKRRSDYSGPPQTFDWYWQLVVGQVNSLGKPLLSEFEIRRLSESTLDPPSSIAVGQSGGRFIAVGEWPGNFMMDSFLVRLNRSFALRNLARLPSGETQFDLVGPTNWSYGIEVSSNVVDWGSITPGSANYNRFGRVTIPASVAGGDDPRFFRAFDGQTACRENQRLIQQAKQHWALEHNKTLSDTPLDGDLFGPGRYLPTKPVCPNGGTYFPSGMITHPSCSLAAAANHQY